MDFLFLAPRRVRDQQYFHVAKIVNLCLRFCHDKVARLNFYLLSIKEETALAIDYIVIESAFLIVVFLEMPFLSFLM
jgi:hypothetical protein